MRYVLCATLLAVAAVVLGLAPAEAQTAKQKKNAPKVEIPFPPKLPDGKEYLTATTEEFLKAIAPLREGVSIARTPPTVDFVYFPYQDYPGNPWSNWGDSIAVNGRYYASIGDHWSVDSKNVNRRPGNALVFEYDPETKKFRVLVDMAKLLGLPEGHYLPGKIHGRLDIGDDGYIYFSTHRGSTSVTQDKYHYKGDWIVRVHPGTGKTEILAQGPVPKHCIPCSVLDPKRLIFYGGTAQGTGAENEGVQFFAYDVKSRKVIHTSDNGPSRYMGFAKSTGRIYFNPGKQGEAGEGPIMRWDPDTKKVTQIPGTIGIRAATQETPQGIIYTVSKGHGGKEATLYAFNTKTEKVEVLGPAAVGKAQYITTIDADPTGRYVYYTSGAHGGTEVDGCPIVQFDTQTRKHKVIAFLHPYMQAKTGSVLRGTFSSAIDEKGEKLYVNWNASRGSRAWDSCALTVIHIPKSERP